MSPIAPRPQVPSRAGEVLCSPAFVDWEPLATANRTAALSWQFTVAGVSAESLRRMARSDSIALSLAATSRLGIHARHAKDSDPMIVATGHQPELYHPGVWIKDFLLERFARESDSVAFDLVVDTDAFAEVAVDVPCIAQDVRRCHYPLAIAGASQYYASTPVPAADEISTFAREVTESTSTLGSPEIEAAWRGFASNLVESATGAKNLAELVTIARRRHEAEATGYLELPLTSLVSSHAFAVFVADLALEANRFAMAYNGELRAYREATGTRSNAQPVPDLRVTEAVELPLWALTEGRRHPVFAEQDGQVIRLTDGERTFAECPASPDSLVRCIVEGAVSYAPKALALTLFVRMFCCDLFIHGTGGGRYDRVTDGVIRQFYGVEPPGFAVASATLALPVQGAVVTQADVSSAKEKLNRLKHHPDEALSELNGRTDGIREAAAGLLSEKRELVRRIAEPDADKKALGVRIREVNAELAAMLAPLRAEHERALREAESGLAASDILTDRTYPLCFWPARVLQELAQSLR